MCVTCFYNPKSKVINTSAEFARNWQFLIYLVHYSYTVVMVCSMKQDRYVHTLSAHCHPLTTLILHSKQNLLFIIL